MDPTFLSLAEGRIAYQRQVGDLAKPEVLFLGGFASTMKGTKASFLAERCQDCGLGFTRFDYRGCGQSAGKFIDMTIGDWLSDACAIFDHITQGPQIIIGSSMGGWLGLLVAKVREIRAHAFIGIAAAPDFTEELIFKNLTPEQKNSLEQDGKIFEEKSPIDHNFPITLKLIEEARRHLIFCAPLALACPIRLLQGTEDKDVPSSYAKRLSDHLDAHNVRTILIENGNHRLNMPENLETLWQTVTEFI